MGATIDAFRYLQRGLRMAMDKGLRPWVVIPLLFNLLLFGTLYWLSGSWINSWIDGLAQYHFQWHWLATLVSALVGMLHILVWILLLALFASVFTMAVQLVAAPFMGLLAERVDQRATGHPLPDESVAAMVVRTFARELRKTWYWLWRAVLMLVALGILSLIPGINVLAPVIWFLWSAWLLGMQYLDFGADNRQFSFQQTLSRMKSRRLLVLSFGSLVLGLTMLPLVNLFIMPVAVIAGTLIWVERLAPPGTETLQGQGATATARKT